MGGLLGGGSGEVGVYQPADYLTAETTIPSTNKPININAEDRMIREDRRQLEPSQPYITGVPSSGVIGPASGIGFSGGYRNASGKMGFASSLGLVGIIGIFGALYLLNRYLEAQPKK